MSVTMTHETRCLNNDLKKKKKTKGIYCNDIALSISAAIRVSKDEFASYKGFKIQVSQPPGRAGTGSRSWRRAQGGAARFACGFDFKKFAAEKMTLAKAVALRKA